jgi:hypothetical protein
LDSFVSLEEIEAFVNTFSGILFNINILSLIPSCTL